MSKKTRKEKIAAENRRKQQKILAANPTDNSSPITGSAINYTLNLGSNVNSVNQTLDSYAYVKSDLIRILILASLAFCAQLVLWYLLGNRI